VRLLVFSVMAAHMFGMCTAAAVVGSSVCSSVDGTWNASPMQSNPPLVQIVQNGAAVSAAWWLPKPTTNVSGTFSNSSAKFALSNGLSATASTSSSTSKCTKLTFDNSHSVWCLVGAADCGPPPTPPAPPVPPTPFDPKTAMPMFTVPPNLVNGGIYPNKQPAYYFMNYTASNSFVIHLSGGGWRYMSNKSSSSSSSSSSSVDSMDSMEIDGLTSDGLSLGSDGSCYGKCDGILSDDANINPLFHSWNKIWIPISGTSFTGDRDSELPYPVRGKRIQTAVIADLLENHGMKNAANVILTGGSSGGLATYLTCDRVGEQVKTANPTARYTCLADAGYFLDHPDIKGNPSTTPLFQSSYYAWNSSSGTNQACVDFYKKTGEDWKCIFAQYVAPFITSELFVMQNLYDSWQINNILKIGCSGYNKPMTSCSAAQMTALESYGGSLRSLLSPFTSNPKVGMFTPSCIAHCQSVENEHDIALWYWPGRWSIVGDKGQSEYPRNAFNDWYSGTTTGNSSKFVQQCAWSPDTCNKLCPDWT